MAGAVNEAGPPNGRSRDASIGLVRSARILCVATATASLAAVESRGAPPETAAAREQARLCERLAGEDGAAACRQALALGIVTRVVADAEVESAAHELAMSLAQGPSVTLGYIKRNINNAEHLSLEACFDAEAIHHSRSGETADHKEAAKAFVEKRKPVFQGH